MLQKFYAQHRKSLMFSLLLTIMGVTLLMTSRYDVKAENQETSVPLSSIESTETPMPELSLQASLALDYITQTYSIPISDLQVANEYQVVYPLIERTFIALTIWTIPPAAYQEFNLLVDLADNQIEADVNAIRAMEAEAYRAKYGKLHPDLYERLQKATDEELISIAIWLLPAANARSQEELYTILVEKYPEAAEAMKVRGVPWGVADENLSRQIYDEYIQMLTDDVNKSTQPLLDKLNQLGIDDVTAFDGMPSLALRISKPLILEIETYAEVAVIYLVEGEPAQPSVGDSIAVFLPVISR